MKIVSICFPLIVLLSGCVMTPHDGKAILTSGNGEKICGIHGTLLKSHKGYKFDGLMHGNESYEFAARRFPNTLGPNFSHKYNEKLSLTVPCTKFTCEECIKEHQRLKKIPIAHKRNASRVAMRSRDRQKRKADLKQAEKIRKATYPEYEKQQEGDDWVSQER